MGPSPENLTTFFVFSSRLVSSSIFSTEEVLEKMVDDWQMSIYPIGCHLDDRDSGVADFSFL
jgi:hypothetical protein